MADLRIAIVGFGKIARDQHLEAIAATDGVTLTAIVDPHAQPIGLPQFPTIDALLRDGPEIDAVALCTPPQVRSALAITALKAGKHVLLEKPPGATVSEVDPLRALATQNRRTLFATWHARYSPAVEPARDWLAARRIDKIRIIWKEDVRVWHPGQAWIFEAGGFGVFDPGINALSILTRILPQPVFVTRADLDFPSNRGAPIAATLALTDLNDLAITAEFDFRQTSEQSWDIVVDTDSGVLKMSRGGAQLTIDGETVVDQKIAKYPAIYRRFVDLCATGASDVDLAPLRLVADAFMLGRRIVVAPFQD